MHKHFSVFLLFVAALSGFGQAKRPMTFEDMMQMKRLGETAVSPDGKWLAYSVTTVDLDKNTKSPELWLQPISGGEPQKIAVAQPGDCRSAVLCGRQADSLYQRAHGGGADLARRFRLSVGRHSRICTS